MSNEIANRGEVLLYSDESGELEHDSIISKTETVQQEGERQVRQTVDHYNLDAIIAVGHRVNSKKATRFRQWATKALREYIQNGFIINDEFRKKQDAEYISEFDREFEKYLKGEHK